MNRRELDLKSLLDIPLWETVQDQLARLTGTAIMTVDFKGNPLTKHSCRTEFCSVIRESPVGRKRCFRCDSLAGLEAVRLGRPYIYLCHCGILDVAVPVTVGNRYLGAVMFGQVRLPKEENGAKVERLISESISFQPDDDPSHQDLLALYNQLPEMEYSRIVEIADLISALVKYIIDRAMRRRNEALTYEFLLHGGTEQAVSQLYDMEELALSEEAPDSGEQKMPSQSSPVYPAVEFVNTHRHEAVSMGDMAKLCHLSPSYFSRLFRREMGENFISYVNRQKVQWAKELLRQTSSSVSEIAAQLGYLDSSYFINVFKRFEGITPLAYRQKKY